jgi:UvrD-like helicase C-terminal domain/AAA domain
MTLLFASTFTDALSRLTGAEQKLAKLKSFDLQMDPKGNGLQMHRLDKAPGFWSVRVNSDIRIILYKSGETTVLAYVDHHDDAYAWAERKRVAPHERTGAMQFVEVPVVSVPRAAEPVPAAPVAPTAVRYPFATLTDDQMLDVGVPRDWLGPVRDTPEADLFEMLERLPAEAAEALLDYATGGRIEDHVAVKLPDADPFLHPDAQRRFRSVDNIEELKAALDQPFEKWAVFLHPAQRALVERSWSGPARVSGSAGTGKTIVALHRAAHLARSQNAKVLLTTFSKPLATALAGKLAILAHSEPALRDLVTVTALDQAAHDLYSRHFNQPTMASNSQVRAAIKAAMEEGLGGTFTAQFLFEEWDELVDAWNVTNGDAYAGIPRLGRRTRLGAAQREAAWGVFDFVLRRLSERKLTTWSQLYSRLAALFLERPDRFPYGHVVVDEAQDLSVAQGRFLAAIGTRGAEAIFFTGDQGQRIFHLPFSWLRLGIDIRGRSHSLKVNYRTSHQIRTAADRLLPSTIVDVDGVEEGRRGTVSVFDGPDPVIALAENPADEAAIAGKFIASCVADGMQPSEIAILIRTNKEIARARKAVAAAEVEGVEIITMHDAKGLEFRCVVVMACDDDIIPEAGRIAAIGDMAEMEAVYESERHLLYVACTRPRDRLMITAVAPGSEFLDDLG